MKGNLMTAISHNKEVRIYVAETTEMVEAARATHDLSPMSTAALGRTLTGAVIMGMMSKIDKEKLTLQIKGTNDIDLLIAVADTHGHVKAYTSSPHAPTHLNAAGKFDVGGAVGADGRMIVIRDIGMKEPFIGQSKLVSGEIAEDLAHYFMQSEQQATAVGLGVLLGSTTKVMAAGGFIVQLLPGASEETIGVLEGNLSGMKSVTALFEDGLTTKQIAHQVLAGLGLEELEDYEIAYTCDCSWDKMRTSLKAVGRSTLTTIRDEDGQAETVCHFCKSAYTYDAEALTEMIEEIEKEMA
ncbi:Hsp33 family molecular chaperone HslO [Fusibacter sp. JL298sf-3]